MNKTRLATLLLSSSSLSSSIPPQVALILIIGGSLVLFPSTNFSSILFSVIGMLFACISFSFLIYTAVNRSSYGLLIALAWMVVWTILYPIIETSITANGMAAFGWNFVMAFYRACFLMQSGVQNATLPGYNLASAIVWLYIDTVLYLILAWYFTTYRRKPSTAFKTHPDTELTGT